VPDQLDADTLRWAIPVVVAVLLVAMFLVVRFVQRLVLKVVLFAALAGFGLALWIQRADLEDCAVTCSCTLFGVDVEIPPEQVPVGGCPER
jgi:hypothetical protein